MSKPDITVGIIVLNGEPFIRYNLRALYPFAHQIIVVEGACPGAKNISTSDGHSLDTTLETLKDFKSTEDPENKLIIITAEDAGFQNGFWPEKDDMSQAYAKRATGNFIWQIDVDEFYRSEDMKKIVDILEQDPAITAVTFRTHTFWGGLKYKVDSMSLRVMIQDVHRIFAWDKEYHYSSHRPPTVVNADGVDLRTIKWLTADDMVKHGVYMYHYAFLFPKQVEEKCNYYFNSLWGKGKELSSLKWAQNSYLNLNRPFRVYYKNSELSWLEEFVTNHPPQVIAMFNDVLSGKLPGISARRHDDIDAVLSCPFYKFSRFFVKFTVAVYAIFYDLKLFLRGIFINTPLWPLIQKLRRFPN